LALCSLRIFAFHISSILCLYNSSKVPAFWFSVILGYFPFAVLQSFVYTTVLRFQHFGSLFSYDIFLSYFVNPLFIQQFQGSSILVLCSLRIVSFHSSSIICLYNGSKVPAFWFSVLLGYFPFILLQSFVYTAVLRFQHFGSLFSYDMFLSSFFNPLFIQQFFGSSNLVLCSLRIVSFHISTIRCLYNSSKVPAFWFSVLLGYVRS